MCQALGEYTLHYTSDYVDYSSFFNSNCSVSAHLYSSVFFGECVCEHWVASEFVKNGGWSYARLVHRAADSFACCIHEQLVVRAEHEYQALRRRIRRQDARAGEHVLCVRRLRTSKLLALGGAVASCKQLRPHDAHESHSHDRVVRRGEDARPLVMPAGLAHSTFAK